MVIYEPATRCLHYTSAVLPPAMVAMFRRMQEKATYICQAELVAVSCACFTFPDLLRGRLIRHYVDNNPAMQCCIKGSSGRRDMALILLDLHTQIFRLQCDPWFGFVYSEDNLSDLPSRSDYTLLQSLGARFRVCVFPPLEGHRYYDGSMPGL